ncbi:MAG: response regulator transcription factor [Bacteroidota bacterium]
MPAIRILLTEDHQILRDGIKALIASENIEIIGEASSGKELWKLLEKQHPHIILMDISLPDTSGIELTRLISERFPEIKVLILSMFTDESFISQAIKAGAKGYLHKNTTREEMLIAIDTIYSGNDFFSDNISKIILKSYIEKAKMNADDSANPQEILSKREIEILTMFAEGFINKEIADRLFISVRTVESHKNHIMQKLNLKTQVELVKYAIRHNLINI